MTSHFKHQTFELFLYSIIFMWASEFWINCYEFLVEPTYLDFLFLSIFRILLFLHLWDGYTFIFTWGYSHSITFIWVLIHDVSQVGGKKCINNLKTNQTHNYGERLVSIYCICYNIKRNITFNVGQSKRLKSHKSMNKENIKKSRKKFKNSRCVVVITYLGIWPCSLLGALVTFLLLW